PGPRQPVRLRHGPPGEPDRPRPAQVPQLAAKIRRSRSTQLLTCCGVGSAPTPQHADSCADLYLMPAPALLVDDLGELLDAWAVVVRGGLLVGLGEGAVIVLPVGLCVAELVRFHTDLP